MIRGERGRRGRMADDPDAAKRENKPLVGTLAADLVVMRKMLPYLWPKNQILLRVQVVFSLLLLVAAKVFTVTTPIMYKYAIDDLADEFVFPFFTASG